MEVQKLKKSLRVYCFIFPVTSSLGVTMGRDKRVRCTGTSWLHLPGHKYYLCGHVSWYKEPLYVDCLWVSFLVEKQTGPMSPLSLLFHPLLGSNHKEGLCFYSLIKPAWPCPDLCLFCFFLILPRPSSNAISSGRPSCSRLLLEFVSTHSPSMHPLLPPHPNTSSSSQPVLPSYSPFPSDSFT